MTTRNIDCIIEAAKATPIRCDTCGRPIDSVAVEEDDHGDVAVTFSCHGAQEVQNVSVPVVLEMTRRMIAGQVLRVFHKKPVVAPAAAADPAPATKPAEASPAA